VQAIAGSAGFSPSSPVTAAEPAIFLLALTASLVLLAISTIAVIVSAAIERRAPLALILYALTASAWYAFATAIFGDGYVETARHAQAAATCLYAVAVMLFMSLFAPLLVPLGAGVRTAIIAPIAAVLFASLSVAVAALLQPALRTAMAAMPMAIGVVDRPQQNAVAPGPVEVAGWALDPFGISNVAVVTDSGEVFEAARNLPYAGARNEPLALYYPSYPQVANPGFVAELPVRVLAQGGVGIRTLVFNAAGGRTEIDRRRLVAAPR